MNVSMKIQMSAKRSEVMARTRNDPAGQIFLVVPLM
jgi:hypothetical protein